MSIQSSKVEADKKSNINRKRSRNVIDLDNADVDDNERKTKQIWSYKIPKKVKLDETPKSASDPKTKTLPPKSDSLSSAYNKKTARQNPTTITRVSFCKFLFESDVIFIMYGSFGMRGLRNHFRYCENYGEN
jgi:hypothetical protein